MAVSGRKFNRADAFAKVVMHEALERMTPPVRRVYAEIVRTSSVSDGTRLTRVTNREIAGAVRMTGRFVKKAVASIRAAGLIEITEWDRTQTRHPRCIRIVDSDRGTRFVRIPESHPVWCVRPTAFWVWVTLSRFSRDGRTDIGNAKIEKRGGLTECQVRDGIRELERLGIVTKTIEGSSRRTIFVPLELDWAGERKVTLAGERQVRGKGTTGQGTGERDVTLPGEREVTHNIDKNLLYLEPDTQSRYIAHPQPPTGAVVGSVLTDGPTSRPHKPEPEPRTPDDPFEGWPERCRVWWVNLRIQKNPRSVKREWIESGFLQYAFEDVRAKTEADRTAIKNPAAYVASMLDDAGFEAFRIQRQRDERRESIDRPEPQTTDAPEPIDQAAELEPHESGLAMRLPEPDRKPELPDTVRYLVDRISPAAMQWAWQKVAIQGIDPNDRRLVETLQKVHGSGKRPASYKYFEPIFNDLPEVQPAPDAVGYGWSRHKPRESLELIKARAGLAMTRQLFPRGECSAEELERYERRVAEALREEAEREGREYHDTQRAESIELMKSRAVLGMAQIRTADDLQRYERRVAELEGKAGLDPLPVEPPEELPAVPSVERHEPVPAASDNPGHVESSEPIAPTEPQTAEARAETASETPLESPDPVVPSFERHEPVPAVIEPPVGPREARPEPTIAEVAMNRSEEREAARLREDEKQKARINAETERRLKQWRQKEYSGHGDSRGTLDDRCDWVRVTEPEKRREIESRVRAEYQADRGRWPAGRSDPGRSDQIPGTRRNGVVVCMQ